MNGHVLVFRKWKVRYAILAGMMIAIMAMTKGVPLHAQQSTVATGARADASSSDLLARRVTIHLTKVSLARAIDSVSRIANVLVQYQMPMLKVHPELVTVDVKNTPLGIVFEQILNGTTLRVVPGLQESLTIVASEESRQDSVPNGGTITGRIVDSATGQGIAGATVKIAGTKVSVAARDSGRYTLKNVPIGDAMLTVHAFGYRPANRIVKVVDGTPVTARFALGAAPNVLSGVVTTATGVQRRISIGNDITTLNVDSIRSVAPISSVTDLLETRVPGLTVLHSSGVPGDPARLRLRGASSITGNNDPIVIVDGVRVYAAQSDARNASLAPVPTSTSQRQFAAPSPLDQIDPASIATIDVFKGPSASSLYGADAANGVIVITTKKGQAGPTRVNGDVSLGFDTKPGAWPTNYYRFGHGNSSGSPGGSDGFFCRWNDLSCTVDSIVPFQALNDSRYTPFADHGSNQNASLTVSGGLPTLRYSVTGSASGRVGILKLPAIEQERYQKFYHTAVPQWMLRPDNYKTYSGNGSVIAQPTRTTQVTLTTSLFQSAQQRSTLEGAIAQLEGLYIAQDQLGSLPLVTGVFTRGTANSLSWTNTLSVNWQPVSWLPILATGGVNAIQRADERLVPYGINDVSEGGGGVNAPGDTNGFYGLGRGSSLVKTVHAGTTMPGAKGRILTDVGFDVQSTATADVMASTDLLFPGVNRPTEFPTQVSAGNGSGITSTFTQDQIKSSTYGWFLQPRLNLSSRFFASPGFRLDGGSASGSHSGFTGGIGGFRNLLGLPKIDLSFVAIDRQNEAPLGGVLSLFRPRFAFGFAGVQPSPGEKLRLFNQQQPELCRTFATCTNNGGIVSTDGSTYFYPIRLSTIGNTTLRPERSSELETGFDTYLWNDRVQLTVTQYNKLRHDAILSIPVASSVLGSGINQSVNIGVIRNEGTELSLDAKLVENRSFSAGFNATMSRDHNRVIRLNAGYSPFFNAQGQGVVPGYPLFGRWARPIAAYVDANGDGVLERGEVQLKDSVVFLGGIEPNYQLSLNPHLTLWGRLSAYATIFYQNGLNQFNSGGQAAFAQLANAPGTSPALQAAIIAADRSIIGLSQTVNTVRFQSLSVNYAVPSRISRHLHVPLTTVALQGENLGLHTNYRGKDPNVNAFSVVNGSGDQVQDAGQLPQPRTWLLRFAFGN